MIKIDAVTYGYSDERPVLRNLSFEIARGQKTVLLGSNGSGKTTLLKLLDGLIFPRSGGYWFDTHLVTRRSLGNRAFNRAFRKAVVLLFQNPDAMLFNPTVQDELAFGCRQLGVDDIEDRVGRWAEAFELTGYLDRPPFQLSYGEKQKVCLASLLAIEPEVLLLDEPTASLDPRSTGWLIDFLQDLNLTVIVATHNLSLASELGDRILLLSESHELIYDGDVEPILSDEDKLLQANLVHIHRHRHGTQVHRHYHSHDWD